MDSVSISQLETIMTGAEIVVADPRHKIGRELSYLSPPLRTIVVHFGEFDNPAYYSDVLSVVLKSKKEWVLTPSVRFSD